MYAAGQNNFDPGASLNFYNAAGNVTGNLDLDDVSNGSSQRTALVGTSAMETMFAKQADTEYGSAALDPAGGGVCLLSDDFPSPVDCVAWGTATVAGAGASEAAIPDGSSIVRDIGPGCNTLLESTDDSNSSADDFAPAFPAPQANVDAGFNSTCPNTTITKKPKAKTTDRTPKFEFEGGDGFLCSLDGSKAAQCDSGKFAPGKQPRGRHKFVVQATQTDGSRDGTPARYDWKIVKK